VQTADFVKTAKSLKTLQQPRIHCRCNCCTCKLQAFYSVLLFNCEKFGTYRHAAADGVINNNNITLYFTCSLPVEGAEKNYSYRRWLWWRWPTPSSRASEFSRLNLPLDADDADEQNDRTDEDSNDNNDETGCC